MDAGAEIGQVFAPERHRRSRHQLAHLGAGAGWVSQISATVGIVDLPFPGVGGIAAGVVLVEPDVLARKKALLNIRQIKIIICL